MQNQDSTAATGLAASSAVKQWARRLVWVRGGNSAMWHLTGSRQATVTALCGQMVAAVKRRDASDEPEARCCGACLVARQRVTQGCAGVAR